MLINILKIEMIINYEHKGYKISVYSIITIYSLFIISQREII